MGGEQRFEDSVEDPLEISRLEVVEKFSKHLAAEVRLARKGDGFFESKYWSDFLTTKTEWQSASNRFYILLHELAK